MTIRRYRNAMEMFKNDVDFDVMSRLGRFRNLACLCEDNKPEYQSNIVCCFSGNCYCGPVKNEKKSANERIICSLLLFFCLK